MKNAYMVKMIKKDYVLNGIFNVLKFLLKYVKIGVGECLYILVHKPLLFFGVLSFLIFVLFLSIPFALSMVVGVVLLFFTCDMSYDNDWQWITGFLAIMSFLLAVLFLMCLLIPDFNADMTNNWGRFAIFPIW